MVTATVVVGAAPGVSLPRLRRALEKRDLVVALLNGSQGAPRPSLADPDIAIVRVPAIPPGAVAEIVSRAVDSEPGAKVFLLGLEESARAAIEAVRKGACEYNTDTDPERIAAHIVEATRQGAPATAVASRNGEASADTKLSPPTEVGSELIGRSPEARALQDLVRKVAGSSATTILLQGESGSGKDLVARCIHAESARRDSPFVPINCSAIPETLLESELFGHEAGAFTDAKSEKRGLLELADRGTVYLDEVAEMGVGLQAKFLRFLEERSLRHLGGTDSIEIDVLVIAGTNVDLTAAVEAGRFRTDLYYRLEVVPIRVPPLRERRQDIPVLARHFLELHSRRQGKRFEGFHAAAERRLLAHPWPGNIRELRNAIERVVLLEDGPVVLPEMLQLGESTNGKSPATVVTPSAGESNDLRLDRIELEALVRALESSGGNQSLAARRLGVSRDAVRHRIEKYGIVLETRARVTRPPASEPPAV